MSTPMATEKLEADLQGTPTDQTTYRRMIGGIMYLTAKHILRSNTSKRSRGSFEFDIEIKDKKGTENVTTDHLSRTDHDETSDDSDVDDNFPGENLMEITTNDTPWFADFANYLV
ncbi:hypothetical protein Tco_0360153, partial [Tanacetum coccineum]